MWLLFLIFKIKKLIITEKIKVKNIVYVYNLIFKKNKYFIGYDV